MALSAVSPLTSSHFRPGTMISLSSSQGSFRTSTTTAIVIININDNRGSAAAAAATGLPSTTHPLSPRSCFLKAPSAPMKASCPLTSENLEMYGVPVMHHRRLATRSCTSLAVLLVEAIVWLSSRT